MRSFWPKSVTALLISVDSLMRQIPLKTKVYYVFAVILLNSVSLRSTHAIVWKELTTAGEATFGEKLSNKSCTSGPEGTACWTVLQQRLRVRKLAPLCYFVRGKISASKMIIHYAPSVQATDSECILDFERLKLEPTCP